METEIINNLFSETRNRQSISNTQRAIAQQNSYGGASEKIQTGEPGEQLTDTQAEAIAQSVNNFLESVQTDLKVEIHKETHKAIFRIVRKEDNKVIQEIPPKSMLDIEANIEKMVGSIININA